MTRRNTQYELYDLDLADGLIDIPKKKEETTDAEQ